jgi:cytochrome c551/c552
VRIRIAPLALLASTALSLAAVAPAHAALDDDAAQALLKKSTCTTCHKLEKTAVGPSFQDIAKKRKGQANALDDLKKVVRSGSTGTYGTASMPAFAPDKISEADLTNVVEWILTK